MTFGTKFLLFVLICVLPNNPITACGATSFPGYHSFPKWAIVCRCGLADIRRFINMHATLSKPNWFVIKEAGLGLVGVRLIYELLEN